MKSPYEQRQTMSIHTRHFGVASNRARLFYTILLIACLIIGLTVKILKAVPPTKFEKALYTEEGNHQQLSVSRAEATFVTPAHPSR